MKERAIRFLYAIDCYLLYVLSSVAASLGVVAYYSISAARDIGNTGTELDVTAFSEYISEVLSGKSSLVLLVSYIIVIMSLLIVFAIRRKSLSSYTGVSYCRFVSLFASVCLGIALNFLASFFSSAQSAEESVVSTVLILCIIIGPFVEEIMFRGVLLKMFASSVGVVFSVIITSLLFAFSHGDIVQIAYTFVLGLILGIVRYKSTSLWSPLALHMSFNVTGAIAAFCNLRFDGVDAIIISFAALLFFFIACTGGRKARKSA